MNDTTIQCPKCKHEMQTGFLLDCTYGGFAVGSWYPGQPEKSFWRGTKVTYKEGVPIRAFRCSGCGFLEFYADKEFAAE
jgi:hypothetical protein